MTFFDVKRGAFYKVNKFSLKRQEALTGFMFVFPWVLSLLLFTAYPIVASLYFSFTDYNIIQSPRWVGLENYRTIWGHDPQFWKSATNTGYYVLLSVPLNLIISLLLAIILNIQTKGIDFYRTLFYLPALTPPVVATIIFVLMFSPDGGLVNAVLEFIGLPTPGWFTDPNWSKNTLVIMSLWGIGPGTLIFLGGLKGIPQSLLDAASVDGASTWQRFRHVTLPLLSPVILFNLVMGVNASFQVFTQALIIGGTTGQPVESLLMYMIYIYQNAFAYFKMGYASALSVVLFIAILVTTFGIFWSARYWVHYEEAN